MSGKFLSRLRNFRPAALPLNALLLGLIFMLWVAARPQNVFWTVDEGGKFIYMQQFLRTNDPTAPLDYPGRALDPEGTFYPSSYVVHRDGQVFMWWSIGFPLLSAPWYRFLGWLGLYLLPAAAGVLTCWLAARVVRLLLPARPKLALLAFWMVGLCTPIAFYSTMFWEHTLTACGVMAALLGLLAGLRSGKRIWFILAGVSAGLAVFFRMEVVAILAGFGLALLFRRWRSALWFGFSFGSTFVPLAFWHWKMTGFFFPAILGSVVESTSFSALQSLNKSYLAYVLFNPRAVWTLELPRELIILGSIAIMLIVPGVFIRRLRWLSALAIGAALLPPLWILTSPVGYRSLQGLVTAGPVILAAVWFFARPWRETPAEKESQLGDLRTMLACGLVLFFAFYVIKAWVGAGGLQWGPRYLLPFYPLLTTAGIVGLGARWGEFSLPLRRALAGIYVCSALIGFGFEIRGALSVRQIQAYYQASQPAYQALPDQPVVTAWCDIVYLLPDLYWQKPFFSVTYPSLDKWASHAKNMGIDSFYVAGLDLCSSDMLDQIAVQRQTNPSGLNIILFRTVNYPNHEPTP